MSLANVTVSTSIASSIERKRRRRFRRRASQRGCADQEKWRYGS
jgi:hypothetical protein